MELQNLIQLEVRTFDSPGVVKVTVSDENGVLCSEILHKAGKELGLKVESLSCFTICQGLERPVKLFKKDDLVPVDTKELSLHKWCFDLVREREVIHRDPAATNLFFLQACHDVRTGRLKPNPTEAQQLDDCLDPDFPADGQYIKLCQGLPDYCSLQVRDCVVCSSEDTKMLLVSPSTLVDVVLSRFGLRFIADQTTLKFTWYELKKWTVNVEKKSLAFTFTDQNCGVGDLPLFTEQVEYLFSGMAEMLRLLQQFDPASDLTFHTDMVRSLEDGSTEWTNGLFQPHKAGTVRDKL